MTYDNAFITQVRAITANEVATKDDKDNALKAAIQALGWDLCPKKNFVTKTGRKEYQQTTPTSN